MTRRTNRSGRLRIALLGGLAALAVANPAQAHRVTTEIGGFIQIVVDTHGVLDGSVVPAGRFSAQVWYETGGTDLIPADPGIGLYAQDPPMAQMRVQIGSYEIEVPMPVPIVLTVLDDVPAKDGFSWRMEGNTFPFPDTASSQINYLEFSVETTDTSVLSSDALPLAALDIAGFPDPTSRRFAIDGCLASELVGYFCEPSATLMIHGFIYTLPEPHAAAAGVAVIAALSALTRRGRSGRASRRRSSTTL